MCTCMYRSNILYVTSGVIMSRSVTLVKGKNNMIGISIGGGAPMCPVLYVVQVCLCVCVVHVFIIISCMSRVYVWE